MMRYGGRTVGLLDASPVGLAGGCPANPPAPPGFAIWKGPVPPALTQWAIVLRDRINAFPYGQQWTASWNGQTVLARKDYHTWTFRKNPDGSTQLAQNICIPGITLYRAAGVGVSGLLGEDATDPARAAPDPDLALYSGAPHPTSWRAVAAGTAFGATLVGVLWWFSR